MTYEADRALATKYLFLSVSLSLPPFSVCLSVSLHLYDLSVSPSRSLSLSLCFCLSVSVCLSPLPPVFLSPSSPSLCLVVSISLFSSQSNFRVEKCAHRPANSILSGLSITNLLSILNVKVQTLSCPNEKNKMKMKMKKMKKMKKGLRILNLAFLLVVFKRRHGSERVKWVF